MAAAIGLREDFDAKALRALAKRAKDGPQARRLLALAAFTTARRVARRPSRRGDTADRPRLGAALQRLGPEGLVDRKAPGQPSLLNESSAPLWSRIVEVGPMPAIHGVVRWRIVDLCQWLLETFRLSISETTVGRELRKMGYRKLSARPRHHAQAAGAIEDFKKVSRSAWRRSPARKASRRAT